MLEKDRCDKYLQLFSALNSPGTQTAFLSSCIGLCSHALCFAFDVASIVKALSIRYSLLQDTYCFSYQSGGSTLHPIEQVAGCISVALHTVIADRYPKNMKGIPRIDTEFVYCSGSTRIAEIARFQCRRAPSSKYRLVRNELSVSD